MSPKDEVITIKMRPVAVRRLARMMYDAGAHDARVDDEQIKELEAADDRIGNMELEIAGLQQQVEALKENLAEVTRDRDELLFSVIDMATDFKLPRNEASRRDQGAEMSLFWLKNEVVRRVIRQADEERGNNVDTPTNAPEGEV